MLAPRGIRANSVAPGPSWAPLIPSTMPEEQVKSFGEAVPLNRPGQPARSLLGKRSSLSEWVGTVGHGDGDRQAFQLSARLGPGVAGLPQPVDEDHHG
jgi:NAD(P)-dependent dehydrogenase (short-subunit alcohol dehydrogenase family)